MPTHAYSKGLMKLAAWGENAAPARSDITGLGLCQPEGVSLICPRRSNESEMQCLAGYTARVASHRQKRPGPDSHASDR